jgi:hypothetical protein
MVVVEAVVVEAVVVEAVVVEAVVAVVDPVVLSSCAIRKSTTGLFKSNFGDDVLPMTKAVGEAPGCPPSERGILLPVSALEERGVRRVLKLPFLGEASPLFVEEVDSPALRGKFADAAPGNVRAGNFEAVTLPDGFADSDAFDPSGLARWSPGMTDCARVLNVGVVIVVAFVAVVAVELDELDAAAVVAGDRPDGARFSGCRLFSVVLVLLLTMVFLSL